MENLLSQKRAAILEKWFQLITESYPSDTSKFLKRESDRFTNPVGYTISSEIEVIYDEILGEMQSETLSASLDKIIRIIAIQDFAPSQALTFLFQLKKAIRSVLDSEINRNQLYSELGKVETKIDKLALMAIDIYSSCREKVYEIRVNEAKTETEQLSRVLERANMLYVKTNKGGERRD